MSDLLSDIQSRLPDDWKLTNLSFLNPDWQAIISDEEHVTSATGETIEEALLCAGEKALRGRFIGRLFHLEAHMSLPLQTNHSATDLLSRLNLIPKGPALRRL